MICRSRVRFGEAGKIEQDICGRMPAADHEHATARIVATVAPEHIGDAVGDPIRECDFADGRRAGGRGRVLAATTFRTHR